MFFVDEDKSGSAKGSVLSEQEQKAQAAYRAKVNVGTDIVDNFLGNTMENWLKELATQFSVTGFAQRAQTLDVEATKIRNIIGLNKETNDQFQVSIAKNASLFREYGYDVEDIGATYEKIFGNLNASVSVADETLLNLRTTSQVTGQDIGELVNSFRGVGVGISDIGDRMLEVVNIAREAGVATKAVSDGVVKNLDKMNIYNFEGGTKGLAKMSAQATKLGIDMTKIFEVVDKVFNPEGAIELAAGLQRLGVQSSALLDPLRLMDLSQNDPTELQNQIVEMSKDFVRFNKELNQFEIMPGEKRRMNEIGKALGMNNGELQKMALNAANLEYKMKQIKLPSGIASKEDKELIATLATINKEGIAQVKVEKLDAEGKGMGEYFMKAVDQLNPKDIENLRKQQEMQGKSMEEIALEQLDETKILSNKISQFLTATAYGISGSKLSRDVYKGTLGTVRAGIDKLGEVGSNTLFGGEPMEKGETWMKKSNELYGEYGPKAVDMMEEMYEKSKSYITEMVQSFSSIPGLEEIANIDLTNIAMSLTTLGEKVKDGLSYFGIGGSETDLGSNFTEKTEILNKSVSNTVNQLGSTPEQKIEFEPLEINENVNVTIKVDLDPNIKNQALTQLATDAIEQYFHSGEKSGVNKVRLKNALDNIMSDILVARKNVSNLVSAPGKPV